MIDKINKFIDTTFGEENEYVVIKQSNGFILIDGMENTINIKNFNKIEELIENYIENRNTKNFFKTLIDAQAQEIDFLEKKLRKYESKYGGVVC